MRREPLEIPRQRAGEPEEADGDDRDCQRQHLGPLGGARNQIAGGCHQADAAGDRAGAKQDGHAEPPPRRRCEADHPGYDRLHAVATMRVPSATRPQRTSTTRSAHRTTSGAWVITSTVERPRNPAIASAIAPALWLSTFAVGSSS